jgi:hypothetical protein
MEVGATKTEQEILLNVSMKVNSGLKAYQPHCCMILDIEFEESSIKLR